MAEINDKTKIPLGWALAIGASLLTGVASAAVSQYKISVHDEEIKELKQDLKDKAKDDINRDLDLREMNGKLDNVVDKIGEVKEAVNKLERSVSRERDRK